jgi:8-oxo-dGTP diphosphatase
MTGSSGHFNATLMNLARSACPNHPRVAVGAVVFKDERVLLVQRGRPPGIGQWAIPGGKVKLGETLQEAAEREIIEETGIVIKAGRPIYTCDNIVRDADGTIAFHYIIVDLEADYVSGIPRPADDAEDVRWATAQDLSTLTVSASTIDLLRTNYRFGI